MTQLPILHLVVGLNWNVFNINFDKRVTCDISAAIFTDFGVTMHISPTSPTGDQKYKHFKQLRWWMTAILKNR